MMSKDFYYWMDTTESWNAEPKGDVILIRGELDEEGEKIRNTEEEILKFNIYEDAGADPEDGDSQWDVVDAYIKEQLGFLPDYEIN